MRWYKIEFHKNGIHPDGSTRFHYVERQYSSSNKAQASASVMAHNFGKKNPADAICYTVTPL